MSMISGIENGFDFNKVKGTAAEGTETTGAVAEKKEKPLFPPPETTGMVAGAQGASFMAVA